MGRPLGKALAPVTAPVEPGAWVKLGQRGLVAHRVVAPRQMEDPTGWLGTTACGRPVLDGHAFLVEDLKRCAQCQPASSGEEVDCGR